MPVPVARFTRLAERLAARPPRPIHDPDRKLAAVAITLVPDPLSVLLIRRAEREGDRWSGQMAFPGGRWAPEDVDLVTTARRETREEVGLDLDQTPPIGVWDDVAPRTPLLPPVIVRPFVFVLPAPVELSPNHEVADAYWVTTASLLADGVYRPFPFQRPGVRLLLPGYHLELGLVWGMTERILTPLLSLIRETVP